jgi:hypothetical protein
MRMMIIIKIILEKILTILKRTVLIQKILQKIFKLIIVILLMQNLNLNEKYSIYLRMRK